MHPEFAGRLLAVTYVGEPATHFPGSTITSNRTTLRMNNGLPPSRRRDIQIFSLPFRILMFPSQVIHPAHTPASSHHRWPSAYLPVRTNAQPLLSVTPRNP